MTKSWETKKETFFSIDVRNATENFLPGLLKKARNTPKGEGICVIQTFEPIPLYSAMAEMGFDHVTEKAGDQEYHTWFYREKELESSYEKTGNLPLKPTAILNFKKVDAELSNIALNFWNHIWGKEHPAIDLKTKLLLSLANGVGAGRFRQATRELIKAQSLGVSTKELDELFDLFAWNGGMGTFASEIGPSPLFGAYQLIKKMESQGKSSREITEALLEHFGEGNPQVSVEAGKGNFS